MESKIEITILVAWTVMLALGMVIILFSQNYRTKIVRAEKEKQIAAFRASFEAEERQKEKIANNLHDEIIPLLTALGQNSQLHKKKFLINTLDPNDLEKDFEIVNQAIKAIRSIAMDLIPTTFLNFGLLKALEQYIGQIA